MVGALILYANQITQDEGWSCQRDQQIRGLGLWVKWYQLDLWGEKKELEFEFDYEANDSIKHACVIKLQ